MYQIQNDLQLQSRSKDFLSLSQFQIIESIIANGNDDEDITINFDIHLKLLPL